MEKDMELTAESTVSGTVIIVVGADTYELDILAAQNFLDVLEDAILEAEE